MDVELGFVASLLIVLQGQKYKYYILELFPNLSYTIQKHSVFS